MSLLARHSIAFFLYLSAAAQAEQSIGTSGPCDPVTLNTGQSVSITFNGGCNIGFSALEVQKIVEAAVAGRQVPGEFADRYEALTKQFGVSDAALTNFFRILGENKVPLEDLDATLRKVAAQHIDLLRRISSLTGNDPQSKELKSRATAAVENGNYGLAEDLLNQAISIDIRVAKEAADNALQAQLLAAKTTSDLASLKLAQLQYATAAKTFLEAVELTPEDEPLIGARYLSDAGLASADAGDFQSAFEELNQSLNIYRELLGPDDPAVGRAANNLGVVLFDYRAFRQAEILLKDTLRIAQKTPTDDGTILATAMTNLGLLYTETEKHTQAQSLLTGALAILEKQFGPADPRIAGALNSLGVEYRHQKKYNSAEELLLRALSIDERAYGSGRQEVANDLNNLGTLYVWQGGYEKAVPFFERAVQGYEKSLGTEHVSVGLVLLNLADAYQNTGRSPDARQLKERALKIFQSAYGTDDSRTKSLRASLNQPIAASKSKTSRKSTR